MKFNLLTHPPIHASSILLLCRNAFLIIGALSLGYVGLILLDSMFSQAYLSWRFERMLKASSPSGESRKEIQHSVLLSGPGDSDRSGAEGSDLPPHAGLTLGRIEIRRIGLSALILEGTDEGTLHRGLGHLTGTPLPGHQGNAAIAGHRDTFFRALRNIRKNDEITLTTLGGSYRYQVRSIKVVNSENMEVLDDSRDYILTLVTCYPFTFVGSAPNRFIVRAQRTFD